METSSSETHTNQSRCGACLKKQTHNWERGGICQIKPHVSYKKQSDTEETPCKQGQGGDQTGSHTIISHNF